MSAPPLPPPAAAVVTAKATSSQASGSSTFEIPRPTTVFSDNKEHKVWSGLHCTSTSLEHR
jgi:hypothetical protein